ncbi:MAG TPA: hypothetical protein VL866_21765 [Pyrinomonadaceae bacterium]|nr:hypothetical protein [Pyrinomonadaceae bacterium]
MRVLLTTLKKIFFWNYARNTWQWDLLCVVCLVFIFLTPKGWFDNGERPQAIAHQNAVARTIVLMPEVVASEADTSKIEQQVRVMTGRSDAKVLRVRKVVDDDGRTLGFEVDIQ